MAHSTHSKAEFKVCVDDKLAGVLLKAKSLSGSHLIQLVAWVLVLVMACLVVGY